MTLPTELRALAQELRSLDTMSKPIPPVHLSRWARTIEEHHCSPSVPDEVTTLVQRAQAKVRDVRDGDIGIDGLIKTIDQLAETLRNDGCQR